VFDRWGIHKTTLLLLPFVLNFASAALVYRASSTRYAAAAPIWLVRLLLTIAFAYGTSASLSAILPNYSWSAGQFVLQEYAVMIIFIVACAALVMFALRQKRDVFPLALVAGSFMLISTVYIGSHIRKEIDGIFIIAVWLIAATTTLGFWLMRYVKAWRTEQPVAKGAAL
jgi:hypothetical protein